MTAEERDDFEAGGPPQFLRDPVGLFQRRGRWMALTFGAGLAATLALVIFALDPRYVAKATVLVSSQRISEEFVRSTVQEDPFEKINAMVGETLVRETLADLVEKHGLYPGLRSSEGMAAAVDRMRGDIVIESEEGIGPQIRNSTARLFTISFEADEPQVAATVANDLASLFITAGLRMRSQQARLTTEFLRRELQKSELELRDQSSLVTAFKEQHRGELPSDLDPMLRKLERLENERQSLGLQVAEAENRIAMLLAGTSGGVVAPRTTGERIVEVRQELGRALAVYTDQHPTVVALRSELDALEAELAAESSGEGGAPSRSAMLAGSRRTLDELRRQLSDTDTATRELEARTARIPARQEELGALEEKERVLRETYTNFLRKVQDAEISQSLESAQQGERISVLERATAPTEPNRSRLNYLAAGLLGSLLAALAVGVVLESVDPVLSVGEPLDSVEDLPVLGRVPRIA